MAYPGNQTLNLVTHAMPKTAGIRASTFSQSWAALRALGSLNNGPGVSSSTRTGEPVRPYPRELGPVGDGEWEVEGACQTGARMEAMEAWRLRW